MSYGTPANVTINWSIHAMLRGIGGITKAHHVQGSARDASREMIDWLEAQDQTLAMANLAPSVRLWCVLTSPQLLTGRHEMQNQVEGLPVPLLIRYSTDWLRLCSKVDNWGGGGS